MQAKKLVGVKLSEDLWNIAQKKAIDLKINNSELVSEALEKFLKRHDEDV